MKMLSTERRPPTRACSCSMSRASRTMPSAAASAAAGAAAGAAAAAAEAASASAGSMVASRTSWTQSARLSDMRASATAMFHSTCHEARRIACRGSATACSDGSTLSPLPCSSSVRGRRRRRPRCSITGHSTSSRAPFRTRVGSGEGGVGERRAGGDATVCSDAAAAGATAAAAGAAAARWWWRGVEVALRSVQSSSGAARRLAAAPMGACPGPGRPCSSSASRTDRSRRTCHLSPDEGAPPRPAPPREASSAAALLRHAGAEA